MSTPEADILAVALTRYADSCPPQLHPDCPFAVGAAGERTCKTECRDEVIRLSRPGHSQISVFSGLLFDARQFLLSETGIVPHEGWHTVSLLTRLKQAIRARPCDADGVRWIQREIDVTNALAYLGQRGFDPDWLVRFGVGESLPVLVDVWIGDHLVHRTEPDIDPTGGWFAIAERFMGTGDDYPSLGDWLAKSQQSGFADYLKKWLEQAPLADVWSWSPAEIDPSLTTGDDGTARWLVDRFTRTYLDEWTDQSLHLEYRYLRGEVQSRVGSVEMQHRIIPQTDIATAIANKAVSQRGGHAYTVIPQAVALLGEGRRKEAAALFDAARIIDPTDADAHNNYAFCLTPDDPTEALKVLRHAEELEKFPAPVNRVNQAVALRLLGNPQEALAAVERAFEQSEHMHRSGWLWSNPGDPENAKAEAVDVVTYLVNLGLELAIELGDDDRAEVWRGRIAADEA